MRFDKTVSRVFKFYEVRDYGNYVDYLGDPIVSERELTRVLWEEIGEGHLFSLHDKLGETTLSIWQDDRKESIWLNVVLAAFTILSTMAMGAGMYGVDLTRNPLGIYKGISFSIAIMGVLGAHEFGHYFMARRHGLRTSLPYFIPFPSIIGTLGAFIKHRGPIPDRKALFDVGIAGPILGLIASIIVTLVGLSIPPPEMVPLAGTTMLMLGNPPLFEFLNVFYPQGEFIHPIAFAGWVGMFVTMLNLIPAGQLDGGHILRAMIGEHAKHASAIIPLMIVLLGIFVTYFLSGDGSIWIFWGLILSLFSLAGSVQPIEDEETVGHTRLILGIIIFIVGFLCFTPTPFMVVD